MPFAGTYSAVSPGEIISFSIDFGPQLAIGDSIDSSHAPTTTLTVYSGTDANAANLPIGTPTINGTIISQYIGHLSPTGFQQNVVYRWTVTVTTKLGATLINYAHIPCLSIN